jgi:hypothetical protein
MPVLKGNTSGSINLVGYNIPSTIESFSIVNKSGSSVTVTVYISDGDGNDVAITALNYSLSVGQAYVRKNPIRVLPNNYIYIVTSGEIDYYFTID